MLTITNILTRLLSYLHVHAGCEPSFWCNLGTQVWQWFGKYYSTWNIVYCDTCRHVLTITGILSSPNAHSSRFDSVCKRHHHHCTDINGQRPVQSQLEENFAFYTLAAFYYFDDLLRHFLLRKGYSTR